MTDPSSAPRGEHTPALGAHWQTTVVRTEQLIADTAPDPTPNRATRRAQQRAARRIRKEQPMPDLHGWITQQITHLEALCRSADKEHGRDWAATWTASTDDFELLDNHGILVARSLLPGAAGLLAIHDPTAVLRRCKADRRILDIHKPLAAHWSDYYACDGCGYDGADYCTEPNTGHVNDCPTLLALAEGYGLTEEQRAALDRPEKERPPRKPGFGGMPDALAEQMIRISLATVPPTLRGPNWKPERPA